MRPTTTKASARSGASASARETASRADSVASDIGQYSFEVRDKADTTKIVLSDHGNYATSFVRRNGEWRAIYDINVSEIPAPASRAPAKAQK